MLARISTLKNIKIDLEVKPRDKLVFGEFKSYIYIYFNMDSMYKYEQL